MNKLNYRIYQFAFTLLTVFVLSSSLYYQYIVELSPCPLCLMQRLTVLLLLIVMIISFFTYRRAHLMSIFQIALSCAGLFFSIRHLWLQTMSQDSVPACMPGLETLIRYFPWQTVAHALFWGAGDCAEAGFKILGLSMPSWATIYFIIMFIGGCILFFNTRNRLRK